MKKIALSLLLSSTLLMSADTIFDDELTTPENNPLSGITFDAGLWYMSWSQTSQASSMLSDPTKALDVNYNIQDSMASVASLKLNYSFLSGTIEYSDNKLSLGETNNNESISSLNIGLAVLDYIPYLNVELRYVKSDFKGSMTAINNAGSDLNTNYGSGKFETNVDIVDIILYPFNNYVGLGYRSYDYSFPQDVYVTHDTSGKTLLSSLADLKYEGTFYTLVVDNKKQVDARAVYNGVVYSASYGMGELTPKALSNSKVSPSDALVINNYLGKSKATSLDILLGYSYKSKNESGFGYGLTTGYRYNKIETAASDRVGYDGGYSIRTKFNTEFYGPYISGVISY